MLGSTIDTPSPCTWWDDIYASDACLAYLRANDPQSTLLRYVDNGLIGGTVVGAAKEFNTSATNAVEALIRNPLDGSINWTSVGIAALVGIVVIKLLSASGQVAGEYYSRRMRD